MKASSVGKAQPFRLSARRQDHRVGGVGRAAVANRREGAVREIQRLDVIRHDLGSDSAGVFFHLDHQFRALGFDDARPVFHFGCDGQLPARLDALHQQGFQHRAAGIDRSGVTGRAGADNQDAGVAGIGHGGIP